MKKKERARKRKQRGSIRPGQKVLVKISTNNKTDKNCIEHKVRSDYLLPFGVVGTIRHFIKKKGGQKKKVVGYLVELHDPAPEVIKVVGDMFEGEIVKINSFFNDPAVTFIPSVGKYYVSVQKELCCFLI